MVQSVILSIFENIYGLFTEPSWGYFIASFIDLSSFLVVPMQGGYHAPLAHEKYIMDKYAYQVAGVDEIFLFKQLSNVFKDFYW